MNTEFDLKIIRSMQREITELNAQINRLKERIAELQNQS